MSATATGTTTRDAAGTGAVTRGAFLRGAAGLAAAAGAGLLRPAGLLAAEEKVAVPVRAVRIASFEIGPFLIPPKRAVKTALASPLTSDNILVRLRTAEGVTGLGEGSPFTSVMGETVASAIAMAESLAPLVKGKDPFSIPRIVADLDAWAPGNTGLKCAIETALWDICGKLSGQPVHRLLGTYRTSFETDLTISLEAPEAMAQRAREAVAAGFRAVKVKVGDSPERDGRRLAAVREAIGPDVRIRIDANQGWTPAEAVLVCRAIAPLGIELCEQPVAAWDWAGMKHVRSGSPIPVMADESVHSPHDVIAGIRHDAMDLVNIKLMKSGGILRSVQIAQVAEAAGLPCMAGSMSESRLGVTAGAHVVASQKCIVLADLDSFVPQAIDPILGGVTLKDGTLTVPDAPGLGVEVEPAFLAKLRAI